MRLFSVSHPSLTTQLRRAVLLLLGAIAGDEETEQGTQADAIPSPFALNASVPRRFFRVAQSPMRGTLWKGFHRHPDKASSRTGLGIITH
jgi:hypothetical protein